MYGSWRIFRPERTNKYYHCKASRVYSFFSKNLGRNYVKYFDLVYFTTRVSDVSDTSATQVQHERHECNNSEKRATRNTSATRKTRVRHEWKILITTREKTCFYTPILAIWVMKDCKEKNNFILRTTFCKCIVSMPKCIWKVHYKNRTLQLQKLYQNVIH